MLPGKECGDVREWERKVEERRKEKGDDCSHKAPLMGRTHLG
jgi:hypothetical protein